MMDLPPPAWTALAAIAATLFGASGGIGGYFIARANSRPAMAAAASAAATAALELLLKHYPTELSAQGRIIGALREDVARLSGVILRQTETIQGQTETIEALETHIDELGAVMRAAGLPLPPRKTRAPKKDPA